MDRRGFLKGLFALGAVAVACGKPPGAEAAPAPLAPSPEMLDDAARAVAAQEGKAKDDGVETTNWYYRRRVYYRRPRRVYYRPRRVYYRRPVRVYYRRPRRVFYRRRIWW